VFTQTEASRTFFGQIDLDRPAPPGRHLMEGLNETAADAEIVNPDQRSTQRSGAYKTPGTRGD
jgi:hypothetical protein